MPANSVPWELQLLPALGASQALILYAMSHRDEKCGHCSVAKSMQRSQDFILPRN